MAVFSFVDVSGLGNSGKSAVTDLLREVNGIYVPPFWFELDLIRTPDGLLDLRHHLLTDWSAPRSHHAVEAFRRVAERMGADPAWWNLAGQFHATGHRFNRFFNGNFQPLTRDFANGFVRGRLRTDWPFDFQYQRGMVTLARKILRKARIRGPFRSDVLLATGQDFDLRARTLMTALFQPILPTGTTHIVLNNALEPFHPLPGLDMLDAHQIVVTRDPRDIYVSGQDPTKLRKQDEDIFKTEANYGMGSHFLATNDLSLFLLRQKIYRQQLYKGKDPRILHIRFEDMVRHPEVSSARILAFLGIATARHTAPRTHFRPLASEQNVGIWRRYSGQDEIAHIAREMPAALADF